MSTRTPADQLLAQAIALQQQDRLNEAEQLYGQILTADPRYAPALHFKGLLLHQRNQHADANRLMQQALEIMPDNTVFLDNFTRALMNQGRYQQALPHFQHLLDLNPGNAFAWYELGTAINHLDGIEDAANCWRRALAVEPRFKAASVALGGALRDMTFREGAEAVYRDALRQTPQDPELVCALAELLVEMGRADEAVALLDENQAARGERADTDYYRGVAQITLGQFKEAEKSFRQTIARAPDFYHGYVHLTATTKFALADPIYRYLENAAHGSQLEASEQQVNVHFSLGKILQDNREYDHAFEHFTAGNRACRTLRPYSHTQQSKQATALKTKLDQDFITGMRPYGNLTELPVFIVGMPRSGTTLTEQVLARHPQVRAGGEMVLLHSILRRQLGQTYRRELAAGLAAFDSATFSGIATALETGLRREAGDAARITDKMPSNFLLTGWLHALLPGARIIHCRRDALDTCVSCYTTLFNRGHEFSNDLEDLGHYYQLYLDMMAHWRELVPADRLLELDYESLVADPEPVIRKLLDFIGLPWHADCLDFGRTSKTVQTASVLQVRQPLYTSSVGRWKHYASHLGPLRTALGISA